MAAAKITIISPPPTAPAPRPLTNHQPGMAGADQWEHEDEGGGLLAAAPSLLSVCSVLVSRWRQVGGGGGALPACTHLSLRQCV